ncbi:MAG: serine/threonine protein kinase, partial [Planctomycetaceae bacterium]
RGLCPACLLACGLETNTVGGSAGPAAGSTAWLPPTVEQLAPLFPELDIMELIGRGGMGAVYKARQKDLDRIVALKILPPEIGQDSSLSKSFAERFAREAQAMAKLNHPNIVTIHSFGSRSRTGVSPVSSGSPAAVGPTAETAVVQVLYFFVMEYIDGMSLRQLLDAGTIKPNEALAIVPQICDALQYAHDRGVVHRDIKPENILLNRAGQVKIADFGLAKLVGNSRTGVPPVSHVRDSDQTDRRDACPTIEKIMGTPQYMAPEQSARPGEVDHRADIYSLGVVFYQMLTGELPAGGHGEFAGKFEPPSRKVLIDVRLDEVVLRALEKEPARRYQQVSEVKTQVETIVGTAQHNGLPEGMLPKPRSSTARRWWVAGIVIFLLCAFGLMVFVIWDGVNLHATDSQWLVVLCLIPGLIVMTVAAAKSLRSASNRGLVADISLPSASPGELDTDFEKSELINKTRKSLKIPSIAMLVVGILGIALVLGVFVSFIVDYYRKGTAHQTPSDYFFLFMGLAASWFITLASVRMKGVKNYSVAVTCGILVTILGLSGLAIGACFIVLLALVSCFIGIWSISVLKQPLTRKAFAENAIVLQSAGRRTSPTAILGAVCCPLAAFAVLFWLLGREQMIVRQYYGKLVWDIVFTVVLMVISLIATFGTTV